jgi:hypothetical protein
MAKVSVDQSSVGFFGAFASFLGINALVYAQLTPLPEINLLPKPSPVENLLAIGVEGRILPGAGSVSGLTCSEVEVMIMSEGAIGTDMVDTVRATGPNPSAGCAFSLSGAGKYGGENLVLRGKVLGEAGKTYAIKDKALNIPEGSTLKVNLYLDASR